MRLRSMIFADHHAAIAKASPPYDGHCKTLCTHLCHSWCHQLTLVISMGWGVFFEAIRHPENVDRLTSPCPNAASPSASGSLFSCSSTSACGSDLMAAPRRKLFAKASDFAAAAFGLVAAFAAAFGVASCSAAGYQFCEFTFPSVSDNGGGECQ